MLSPTSDISINKSEKLISSNNSLISQIVVLEKQQIKDRLEALSISEPTIPIQHRCEFRNNQTVRLISSDIKEAKFSDPLTLIPPFQDEEQKPQEPKLCISENFSCEDFCNLSHKNLEHKFPKKWDDKTKRICNSLLTDIYLFCKDKKFPNNRNVVILEIFYSTYAFFVNSHFRSTNDLIEYFYEILLLHSVQHPPHSLEVLSVDNCKIIIEFFNLNFIPQLSLLRAIIRPNYNLYLQISGSPYI